VLTRFVVPEPRVDESEAAADASLLGV